MLTVRCYVVDPKSSAAQCMLCTLTDHTQVTMSFHTPLGKYNVSNCFRLPPTAGSLLKL